MGGSNPLRVRQPCAGNVRLSDLAGALNSYRDSLAIAEHLAKSDPGNAGWQRDLSVSYAKLGSTFRLAGEKARRTRPP